MIVYKFKSHKMIVYKSKVTLTCYFFPCCFLSIAIAAAPPAAAPAAPPYPIPIAAPAAAPGGPPRQPPMAPPIRAPAPAPPITPPAATPTAVLVSFVLLSDILNSRGFLKESQISKIIVAWVFSAMAAEYQLCLYFVKTNILLGGSDM